MTIRSSRGKGTTASRGIIASDAKQRRANKKQATGGLAADEHGEHDHAQK